MSRMRRIMQTWKTKIVPDHWRESPESIKRHMGHWSYHLMDDDDNLRLVTKFFPDFLETYINLPYGICRADAIRYMWLYLYGGFYMDLDFKVQKPFDDLIKHDVGDQLYLVHSNMRKNSKVITNSLMGSTPGHPFWLECLKEIKNGPPWWTSINKYLWILEATGPQMVTRVINRGIYTYNKLPESLLGSSSYCECDVKDDSAYTRQLQGSSWINPLHQRVIQGAVCNTKLCIVVIILIILLIVLYFITQSR